MRNSSGMEPMISAIGDGDVRRTSPASSAPRASASALPDHARRYECLARRLGRKSRPRPLVTSHFDNVPIDLAELFQATTDARPARPGPARHHGARLERSTGAARIPGSGYAAGSARSRSPPYAGKYLPGVRETARRRNAAPILTCRADDGMPCASASRRGAGRGRRPAGDASPRTRTGRHRDARGRLDHVPVLAAAVKMLRRPSRSTSGGRRDPAALPRGIRAELPALAPRGAGAAPTRRGRGALGPRRTAASSRARTLNRAPIPGCSAAVGAPRGARVLDFDPDFQAAIVLEVAGAARPSRRWQRRRSRRRRLLPAGHPSDDDASHGADVDGSCSARGVTRMISRASREAGAGVVADRAEARRCRFSSARARCTLSVG